VLQKVDGQPLPAYWLECECETTQRIGIVCIATYHFSPFSPIASQCLHGWAWGKAILNTNMWNNDLEHPSVRLGKTKTQCNCIQRALTRATANVFHRALEQRRSEHILQMFIKQQGFTTKCLKTACDREPTASNKRHHSQCVRSRLGIIRLHRCQRLRHREANVCSHKRIIDLRTCCWM
jgi:hypothetical protein